MSLVKNTYGVSVVLSPRNSNYDKMGSLAGSCLNRVDAVKKIKAQVDLMNLAIIKKKIVKDKEKNSCGDPKSITIPPTTT